MSSSDTPPEACWEWRAFAPGWPLPQDLARSVPSERVELRFLSETLGPGWSLALRDAASALDPPERDALGSVPSADSRTPRLVVRERTNRRGELERWRARLSSLLPVPPHEVRALARAWTRSGKVPVRPLRNVAGLAKLLADLGHSAPRRLPFRAELRRAHRDGVVVEHLRLDTPRGRTEGLALAGEDPDAVERARAAVALPPGARVASWPHFLRASC